MTRTVTPPKRGRILGNFTKAGNVTAGYNVLFTICAFAYVVSFVLSHFFAPQYEPFEIKEG